MRSHPIGLRSTAIRLVGAGCALVAALTSAACASTTSDPAGSTVNVSVREFVLSTDVSSAPAGVVTFNVRNDGTTMHEFLVIKTDLDEASLPTNADGSYEEDGEGTELIDEVEDVGISQTAELVVDLDVGDYVLICNMVMGTTSHYAQGMHRHFMVE